MQRTTVLAVILAMLLPAMATSVRAEAGKIDRIQFYGLVGMSEPAAKHALGIQEGDPYDPAVLRARFRALWGLGLFKDITIEAETGPEGGKIVVVTVEERARLTAVTYGDNSVLNRTQIEDRLKEREIKIGLGRPLDMQVIGDAAAAIRDYLGEKGHLDSRVNVEIRDVGENLKAVHFDIRPGGKTRIKAIRFEGNEVFKDKKLRQQLKITEARRWYWPWSQKNLYHPLKWDQDSANIRTLYQNAGYLDIRLKAPILEFGGGPKEPVAIIEDADLPTAEDFLPPEEEDVDLGELTPQELQKRAERIARQRAKAEKKAAKARKKAQPKTKRWVKLLVPVEEGRQYRTGTVEIEGNEVFLDEQLRPLIPLREGDVLRNNWLEAGIEAITRRYEDRGHLYAEVVRQIERREDEPIADIVVTVDEDEPYYVDSIEFSGNTSTHDRVLRREVLINEGALFNRTRVDLSQRKINQLGYVEAPDEAIVEPIEGENRVRIRFPVEERGRNEIQVGGGYSGLDGAFFTGVYSTRNFLGRGQVVSVSLQVGGRASRYSISFQEPWFLNRPIALGFSIFRRDVDYGATLQSTSKGGGILIGKRIRAFTDLRFAYAWESVRSNSIAFAFAGDGTIQQISNTAENTISSLTPSLSIDTINNPYRPSAGQRFIASVQVAGGPLGGDTSFIKPIVTFTKYRRAFGRSFLAFNAETGLVREWSDGTVNNSATINGVPRFQRFWLGGDTQGPRVFEPRTITPLRYVVLDEFGGIREVVGDPRGRPVSDFVSSGDVPVLIEVGGDRYYLFQSEIVYSLNPQADLALFVDVGDSLFEDQSWGWDTARVSAGVELRFHLPVFPVPLRLIYGWPLRKFERDRTSSFTFSIGRSF